MKHIFLILAFFFLQLCGFSQQYWEDGFWRDEAKERYDKNLTMAGYYTGRYSNDSIMWKGKVLETGNPDSTWVFYNANGKIMWEGSFTGKIYIYDTERGDEGVERDTMIVGTYVNGIKHGEWLFYNNYDRFIECRGFFRNGEPSGTWEYFHGVQQVVKVKKEKTYDYTTGTEKHYFNDSVTTVKQIDSLSYTNWMLDRLESNMPTAPGDDSGDLFVLSGMAQYLDFSKLNEHFLSPGYKGIESPLYSMGLKINATLEHTFMTYGFFYTPPVTSQVNDSINLRLSGYSAEIGFGGDFFKSHKVALAPYISVGFQQLKLKVRESGLPEQGPYYFRESGNAIYKNPGFYVKPALHFGLAFGHLTISAFGGYQFDSSSPKWYSQGHRLRESPSTSTTGFSAGASIGYHIY
jgi:hypothetical protein